MLRRWLSISPFELEKEPPTFPISIGPYLGFFVDLVMPWLVTALFVVVAFVGGMNGGWLILVIVVLSQLFANYRQNLSRWYRWRVISRSDYGPKIRQLYREVEDFRLSPGQDWQSHLLTVQELSRVWQEAHYQLGLVQRWFYPPG